MTNYDVVRKLIGGIEPAGESSGDERRFENLKNLTTLVELLVYDIQAVSQSKISHEHSVKRAGEYADKFLKSLGEDMVGGS